MMSETRGIGLIGFIIKPVQRICKYPLLLKVKIFFYEIST